MLPLQRSRSPKLTPVHQVWEVVTLSLEGSHEPLLLGTPFMLRCQVPSGFYYLAARSTRGAGQPKKRGKGKGAVAPLGLAGDALNAKAWAADPDTALEACIVNNAASASKWCLQALSHDDVPVEGGGYVEYEPHLLFLEHCATKQRLCMQGDVGSAQVQGARLAMKRHNARMDLFFLCRASIELVKLVGRAQNIMRLVTTVQQELERVLSPLDELSTKLAAASSKRQKQAAAAKQATTAKGNKGAEAAAVRSAELDAAQDALTLVGATSLFMDTARRGSTVKKDPQGYLLRDGQRLRAWYAEHITKTNTEAGAAMCRLADVEFVPLATKALHSLNQSLRRTANEHQKISQQPRTVAHRLLEETMREGHSTADSAIAAGIDVSAEEASFPLTPSPSSSFVPGLPHVSLIKLRPGPQYVPALPHVVAHSRRPVSWAKRSSWCRLGSSSSRCRSAPGSWEGARRLFTPFLIPNFPPAPRMSFPKILVLTRDGAHPQLLRTMFGIGGDDNDARLNRRGVLAGVYGGDMKTLMESVYALCTTLCMRSMNAKNVVHLRMTLTECLQDEDTLARPALCGAHS